MNSPEEKAKELVDKFKEYTEDKYAEHWSDAKSCALICVDEIIEELEEIKSYIDDNYIYDLGLKVNYWQKVKEQIQKLQP